jgi:hypothetical protein
VSRLRSEMAGRDPVEIADAALRARLRRLTANAG